MKYNLKNKREAEEAFKYLTQLVGKEAMVDIVKKSPNRTILQNNYVHLLLGIVGIEYGLNIEEVKIDWKRYVAPEIFVYENNGKKYVRKSSQLDTKEMTTAIDKLKDYYSKLGLALPDAGEHEKLRWYQNNIEKYSSWI